MRRAKPRRPLQLEIVYSRRGGKRAGAGRKPRRPGATPHTARPPLASRFPVHVSYSVADDISSLRKPDLCSAIEGCLREVARRARQAGGFRVVHYSIQRQHLHFIVEAKSRLALSRGLQGLSIRIAKRVNKLLGRSGAVFVDRYFERILRSPKQTRHCILYVLNNARRHAAQAGRVCPTGWVDPCSSGRYFDGWRERGSPHTGRDPPCSPPRTWLLHTGWRRHGLLPIDATPGLHGRRGPYAR